jgi:hypothetical protein
LVFYQSIFCIEFEELPRQQTSHNFGSKSLDRLPAEEYKLLLSDEHQSENKILIDQIKLKQLKKERLTSAIIKSSIGAESWQKNPSKKLQAYRLNMLEITRK